MNQNLKRYLISSAVTFLATFCAATLPGLGDVAFTKAALMALAMVGIRAGVKAVFEFVVKLNLTELPTGYDLEG